MNISCPQCGGPSRLAADNTFRPFCSKRCKLIDLGAWLEGDYAIAGEPVDPNAEGFAAGQDRPPASDER